MPAASTPDAVIDFWFQTLTPAQWWARDPALDQRIRDRFGTIHACAARGGLGHWRAAPHGRLAEVIVLDQFSRNLFRDSALAYAQDALALTLAEQAVALGLDTAVPPVQRAFFYLPYMHSESLATHDIAVELFRRLGSPRHLQSELRHRDVIARFGRYPHRNDALERESTAAEIRFLQDARAHW